MPREGRRRRFGERAARSISRSRSRSPKSDYSRKVRERSEEKEVAKPKPKIDAAAIAAAAAAKINAQLADRQPSNSPTPPINPAIKLSKRDATDDELQDPETFTFSQNVEINDLRNKYLLTKEATQQDIRTETGAVVTTKGKYYPDKTKATETLPPLHLNVRASTQQKLDQALQKIDQLINQDLGSLVDERRFKREEYKSMTLEERIVLGPSSKPSYHVKNVIVGPSGENVKHIYNETKCKVMVKGKGSGYIDRETGKEDDFPMCIIILGSSQEQVSRAKTMTEDLLNAVSEELELRAFLQNGNDGGNGENTNSTNAMEQSVKIPPPPPPASSSSRAIPPPPPPPSGSSSSRSRPPPPPPPPSRQSTDRAVPPPPPPPPSSSRPAPPPPPLSQSH